MIAAFVLAAAIALPDRPKDFVTDTTGTLRSGTVSSLNSELNSYYAATGNSIFVYVAQSTGDVPLEDWTVQTATKWKVGRKGKDDGAILFVFMRDHKMRIEVGYGLEQSLTDASSSEIIRNTMTPKMRAGDPDAAIQDGVDRMLLTITPSYASKLGHAPPATASDAGDSSSFDATAIAVIVLIIFFVIVMIITLSRKGGKGSSAWIWGSALGSGFGDGGGFSGGGGGGFSGGFGGGFGGGGASGGW